MLPYLQDKDWYIVPNSFIGTASMCKAGSGAAQDKEDWIEIFGPVVVCSWK
jgi:hypothetical protein